MKFVIEKKKSITVKWTGIERINKFHPKKREKELFYFFTWVWINMFKSL